MEIVDKLDKMAQERKEIIESFSKKKPENTYIDDYVEKLSSLYHTVITDIKEEISKNIGSKSITLTNCVELYTAYPSGLAMPDYQIGDVVFVSFIDQDMKTMYCEESPVKQSGKKEGERVRLSAPAKKENSNENVEFSKANEYAIEIDSRKDAQRILISTSNLNGEKCPFFIGLDSKNGVFYINAGGEEVFKYNSEDDEWFFKTKGGATASIKDNVISLNCDEFKLKAESKVSIETKNYEMKTDKLTEEATTVKKKYNNLNQEGSSAKFKIQNESHEGLSMRFKHTIGFQVESVISAFNGLVMAAQLAFGSGPPSIDIPISVPENTMKVDSGNMDMGNSNISVKNGNMNMGMMSQPLAKASPLYNAVVKLAAFYDILQVVGQATLIKAFGVTSQISSEASQATSNNVKGQ